MKKYILLIFIVGILTSCDEFLTFDDPQSVTDADWWNSEQDARSALGEVYKYVPGGVNGRMRYSYATDEAFSSTSFDFRSMGNGSLSAQNSTVLSAWSGAYTHIRRANRFLEKVDNCSMDLALKERFKYEARVIRAWIYLDLVRWFGDIPLVEDIVAPNPDNSSRERNAKNDVINFVISELQECEQNLPTVYPVVDQHRMTKGAALAFKAQAHMLLGQWDEAAVEAKKVVDTEAYILYYNQRDSANSYRDLFKYEGELNFEWIIRKNNGSSSGWGCAPPSMGGESKLTPLAELVNQYENLQGIALTDMQPDSAAYYKRNPLFNRDPRLAASILTPGATFNNQTIEPFNTDPQNQNSLGSTSSSLTGFWNLKYVDTQDQHRGGSLDYMVLRLPDVMLLYAEAKVEAGEYNDATAIEYINQIRERAGMPAVDTDRYNSQETMRELVRRERRVELAMEGRRIFDLRRWEQGNLLQGEAFGATDPLTNVPVVAETREFRTPQNYVFPIPEKELLVNKLIQQNEGY